MKTTPSTASPSPRTLRNSHSALQRAAALLLLLLALFLPPAALIHFLPPPSPASTPGPGVRHAKIIEAQVVWYLKSGQWRADSRTLANMVRFLIDPDLSSPDQAPVHA